MKNNITSRFAGAAFLLQAVASAVAGLVLLRPLIAPDSIVSSMANMAECAFQVRAGIVVEMITAIALIILSALLFIILREQSKNIALVAFSLRVVEVALLVVSRVFTFGLLRVSQASVAVGHHAYMQTLGNLFFESQEISYSLSMIFFTLGGTMFYYLFYKSGFIPGWLAVFGLIAASLAFVGELFGLFGISVPLVVFLPNLPFELIIGFWLLTNGIHIAEDDQGESQHLENQG
jgi:Domain of unknown function (DUF4386)